MARILAILCSISIVGMSQGLIIPLLALLLERRGASALFNGISTTAVFLGIVVASPFIERIVRRLGAKHTILYSIIGNIVLTLLFPIWDNVYVWLVLRLLLGITMAGLYVATEIWLNRMLTASNRGRVFAFYGLMCTVGLMIGPQGINLLEISLAAPFLAVALIYLIPLVLMYRVSDEHSQLEPLQKQRDTGLKRWGRIFAAAPLAMLASFVYGYLDGALVGGVPIFGSRIGMNDTEISWMLTVFMLGAITLQFPLGWMSDRWGRRPTLIGAALAGMIGFVLLPVAAQERWMLATAFFCIGGVLGSFYSLGLAALGDLLERGDLATGNVLYTMLYGLGSLLGPSVTGGLIYGFGQNLFAWSIAFIFLLYAAYGMYTLWKVDQSSSLLTHKGRGV